MLGCLSAAVFNYVRGGPSPAPFGAGPLRGLEESIHCVGVTLSRRLCLLKSSEVVDTLK